MIKIVKKTRFSQGKLYMVNGPRQAAQAWILSKRASFYLQADTWDGTNAWNLSSIKNSHRSPLRSSRAKQASSDGDVRAKRMGLPECEVLRNRIEAYLQHTLKISLWKRENKLLE